MTESKLPKENSDNPISKEDVDKLLHLLETIRYGSLTLIIQDGKIVLIEKNEKMKLK